jgi:hypothetical protein
MRRTAFGLVGLALAACGGSSASHGATVTGTVAVLGSACASPAAIACAGNAQKVTLICSGGTWAENGTCPAGQNCNSAPGPNQGTCAPIVGGCENASPGEDVCTSTLSTAFGMQCGPDLVTETPVDGGACAGPCTPNATQCAGGAQMQTCSASGAWGAAIPCGAGAICQNGSCTCPSGESLCNGTCVNEMSDMDNCGKCGTACSAPATACMSGQCACYCTAATFGAACAAAYCSVTIGGTCGLTVSGTTGCCQACD